MAQKTNIGKIILAIIATILLILAWGWVGELDHHRYIEANSTPKIRLQY